MAVLRLWIFLIFTLSVATTFAQELKPEEQKFVYLLNQLRSGVGISTVAVDPSLQKAASDHSKWMSTYGILAHWGPTPLVTPDMRIIEAGFDFTWEGENIAEGHADAVGTFRQWAFSRVHLENMLNPHFEFIGIAREGDDPYYWTNDFATNKQNNSPVTHPKLTPEELKKLVESIISSAKF